MHSDSLDSDINYVASSHIWQVLYRLARIYPILNSRLSHLQVASPGILQGEQGEHGWHIIEPNKSILMLRARYVGLNAVLAHCGDGNK